MEIIFPVNKQELKAMFQRTGSKIRNINLEDISRQTGVVYRKAKTTLDKVSDAFIEGLESE